MKNQKNTFIPPILLAIMLISMQCTDDRERVENNTPPFDPLYFRDTTDMHLAFFLNVRNGVLLPSSSAPQKRPGGMPYHSRTTGDFIVSYRDRNNMEIGRYAIPNPAYIRTCDLDHDTIGEVRLMTSGTIEILTPYDPNIHLVHIIQPRDTITIIYRPIATPPTIIAPRMTTIP